MSNEMKSYIAIALTIWLLIIGISAFWNVSQTQQNQHEVYLENGRALYNLIVITREWNSRLGGVYVPITDHIQPNPYLDDPNRDLTATTGLQLTKLNPAFMTRLIAEIADEQDGIKFHITSLKPIRPENAAQDWETVALNTFENKGQKEYSAYYANGETIVFRYMAPLITQQSCLKCHEQQGYKVGDIRGGISITVPVKLRFPWALVISHIVIALGGGVLILVFGSKLGTTMQTLENLSNVDSLTQIYNRRSFDKYLDREFQHSGRNNLPLSVAICDIDNFKPFNDSYGHQAGDECLRLVAQSLQSVLKRPGDLVFRYGGEEFGVILPYTNADGAQMIGDLLRAKIESLRIPHKASCAGKYVTVSIGISTCQGAGISKDIFVNIADRALYLAKESGRNCVIAINQLITFGAS